MTVTENWYGLVMLSKHNHHTKSGIHHIIMLPNKQLADQPDQQWSLHRHTFHFSALYIHIQQQELLLSTKITTTLSWKQTPSSTVERNQTDKSPFINCRKKSNPTDKSPFINCRKKSNPTHKSNSSFDRYNQKYPALAGWRKSPSSNLQNQLPVSLFKSLPASVRAAQYSHNRKIWQQLSGKWWPSSFIGDQSTQWKSCKMHQPALLISKECSTKPLQKMYKTCTMENIEC